MKSLQVAFIRFILVCLVFSGCGSGRNVLFNPAIQRAATEPPLRCTNPPTTVNFAAGNAVRVYLDRDGDLYPGLVLGERLHDTLFAGSAQPLRASFDTWKVHASAPWRAVADSLDIDPATDGAWTALQDSIRRRSANWVDRITLREDQSRRPLIILVHGFNTSDAECIYQFVSEQVTRVLPDAAFLLVNWDGLVTDSPIPLIWSGAQFNFPLVGIGLRRLLNEIELQIPEHVPVRVLTHSSGGPVIAHALWDGSGAEGAARNAEEWPAYLALQAMREAKTLPAPPQFADLRVGMIVPATPASIFDEYTLGEHGPDRIIIGMNPSDYAVNKTIAISCTTNGDTCLGARASYSCIVRRQFENNPNTEVMFFNFSRSSAYNKRWFLFHDDHAWEVYMRRDDIKPFLQALLTDSPVRDEGAEICRT